MADGLAAPAARGASRGQVGGAPVGGTRADVVQVEPCTCTGGEASAFLRPAEPGHLRQQQRSSVQRSACIGAHFVGGREDQQQTRAAPRGARCAQGHEHRPRQSTRPTWLWRCGKAGEEAESAGRARGSCGRTKTRIRFKGAEPRHARPVPMPKGGCSSETGPVCALQAERLVPDLSSWDSRRRKAAWFAPQPSPSPSLTHHRSKAHGYTATRARL